MCKYGKMSLMLKFIYMRMYLSILPFKGKDLEVHKLLTKVISGHWKKTGAIFF